MSSRYSMDNDLHASEVAFRVQFDKNHPTFHGGDPTPVPLGGQRIPEGMQASIVTSDTHEASTDFGPTHGFFIEIWSKVGSVQSNLNQISRIVLRSPVTPTDSGGNKKIDHCGKVPPERIGIEDKAVSHETSKVLNGVDGILNDLLEEWGHIQLPIVSEPFLSPKLSSELSDLTVSIVTGISEILQEVKNLWKEVVGHEEGRQIFVANLRPILQKLYQQRRLLLKAIKDIKRAHASENEYPDRAAK